MRSFIVALALGASSVAARLAFTSTPGVVVAGEQYNITFSQDEANSPITILLRQGLASDLRTISILTNDAQDGSYLWTPSESLVNGNDYALQITQGLDINYSGQFSLSGGATTSSSSSSSVRSATSSSSVTSASLPGGTLISPASGGFRNASSIASASSGITMSRNTTMVSPTLTSSRTTIVDATDVATTTPAEPTSDQTGAAAAVVYGSSPVALVMCIFAAIMA